jgi:quercetin dioxygenase-like cupin family protein
MQHNKACEREWRDTPYPDIDFSWLWRNAVGGGHAMLKLAKGAKLPMHWHPGWEQIYLLEGRLRVNQHVLEAGDQLLIDAGDIHAIEALTASVYMVMSECEGAELVLSDELIAEAA